MKLTNKTLSGIGDLLGKYKETLKKGNNYISFNITSYDDCTIKYELYISDGIRRWVFTNKIDFIKHLNKEIKNGI